ATIRKWEFPEPRALCEGSRWDDTMRTLVFGGTGMLGRAVVRLARRRGGAALGLSHGQADVTDGGAVHGWVAAFRPQLVVNCAALTKVDDCESRRDEAMAVNGRAVGPMEAAAGA